MLLKFLLNVGLLFTATAMMIDDKVSAMSCSHNVLYRSLLYNVIPRHYDIVIKPQNNTFDGEVNIIIDVTNTTNYINFHAQELEIDKNTILLPKNNSMESLKPKEYSYCNETQIFLLKFKDAIPIESYILRMNFIGSLRGDEGFVAINHITEKEEQRTYVTLFGSRKARRAFPCWDVPWIQTTFDISVGHSPEQIALSNAPFQRVAFPAITDAEFMAMTSFETTPMMATHLVTIAIAEAVPYEYEYEYNDSGERNVVRVGNTTLSVWSERRKMKELIVVQDFAQKIMQFLSEKMGFSWRESTINFLVFPDLPLEGMGSWKLAVVREKDVIYKEDSSVLKTKRAITREIIRQYLDTFVSPSSWSDLWFHKGLTLFLSYHVMKQCCSYKILSDLFVVQIQQPAMHNDIACNMTALGHEPDSLFASFGYNKASALIRMLQYMTNGTLQEIVTAYLNKDKNQRANLDVLWKTLGDKIGVNLTQIVDQWLRLRYYPSLYVKRNYKTGSIFIEQKSALLRSNKSTNDNIWTIPLTYTTQGKLKFQSISSILLTNDSLDLQGFDSTEWVIFNIQQIGYYRVNYDDENWSKIAKYLNTENYRKIHRLNRAQLIDDAYHFMMQGEMDYKIFMNLIQYLRRDTDFVPWHSMMNVLNYMSPFFEFEESQDFKNYMLNIMDNVLTLMNLQLTMKQTWKNMRTLILNWACKHGHTQCKELANRELKTYLQYNKQPPSARWLKDWLYCSGSMIADNNTWNQIANYVISRGDMEILEYLMCTEEDVNIDEFFHAIRCQKCIWKILTIEEKVKLFFALAKKQWRSFSVQIFFNMFFKDFSSWPSVVEKVGHYVMNIYSKTAINQLWNMTVPNYVSYQKINSRILSQEIKHLMTVRKDQLDKQRNMFTRHFTAGNISDKY